MPCSLAQRRCQANKARRNSRSRTADRSNLALAGVSILGLLALRGLFDLVRFVVSGVTQAAAVAARASVGT